MTATPTHGLAVAVDYRGRMAYSIMPDTPVTGCVAGEFDHAGRFHPADPVRTPIQKAALNLIISDQRRRTRALRQQSKAATRQQRMEDWKDALDHARRTLNLR